MRLLSSDFWAWAYADFLSNTQRGVLAEYLIATAAGATSKPRIEWDACDVTCPNGTRVEVKSAAYLQSWQQKRDSTIRFDISHKRAWEQATNTYSFAPVRASDLYVFAIFGTRDRALADPLESEQWFFYVCPTRRIEERFGTQRTVGLKAIEALGLTRLTYVELSAAIAANGA